MRWGGFAGDGLQSTGILLQKYFNSLGYYVQGFPGTQSTIRGGHVWQHVEISSSMMHSHALKACVPSHAGVQIPLSPLFIVEEGAKEDL